MAVETIPSELRAKEERLKERLASLGSVFIAWSGGADSTYLVAVAAQTLGERMRAVTFRAEVHDTREVEEAARLAKEYGWPHRIETAHVLDDPAIAANPPERCYLCKRRLFRRLGQMAREAGVNSILDGSQADDRQMHRPGLRALRESGVLSPLAECGLTKAEIRILSRARGLPTWDRPAAPCLATRIPYHTPLRAEVLRRIEAAETHLHAAGVRPCRVRVHGELARIEAEPAALGRLAGPLRAELAARLRELGFSYVTIDLEGFRSGTFDAQLDAAERDRAARGDDAHAS